jgi:hypothetical protein
VYTHEANEMPSELLLTKEQIENRLSGRQLVVEPILDKEQIDVASIDLRLDNFFAEFKTAKKPHIDPATIGEQYREYLDFVELECFKDFYYLQPKRFILSRTFEYIGMPNDLIHCVFWQILEELLPKWKRVNLAFIPKNKVLQISKKQYCQMRFFLPNLFEKLVWNGVF